MFGMRGWSTRSLLTEMILKLQEYKKQQDFAKAQVQTQQKRHQKTNTVSVSETKMEKLNIKDEETCGRGRANRISEPP